MDRPAVLRPPLPTSADRLRQGGDRLRLLIAAGARVGGGPVRRALPADVLGPEGAAGQPGAVPDRAVLPVRPGPGRTALPDRGPPPALAPPERRRRGGRERPARLARAGPPPFQGPGSPAFCRT